MNKNEINGKSAQNRAELYKKIFSIAQELAVGNETFTRADLASELEAFGVAKDSIEVGQLIMDAYEYYNQNPSIRNAFVNNEGFRSVVEDLITNHLLGEGNEKGVFSRFFDELFKGEESLHQLDVLRGDFSNGVRVHGKSDVLSFIVGTRGLNNVKAEAEAYFKTYSKFVDAYTVAENDVKSVISDFAEIRSYVTDIYREYAMKLVDVFGESVKAVAPNLFDFDAIEYLNVDEMYGTVKLSYDKLADRCVALIGETSKNFFAKLGESANAVSVMGKQGNVYMGLMLAGANMFEHYSTTSMRVAETRQELERFKQDITHDLFEIAGDYTRLESIFSILHNYYIIKAQSFCKYSNKVLSKELQELFKEMYKDDSVRQLAQKRDTVRDECKALERNIADSTANIEYYKGSIAAAQDMLRYKSPDYELAKNEMPRKPFFLVNWLTFGGAAKKYRRHFYDWQKYYKPVIEEYDRCRSNIVLDRDELATHQSNLKAANAKLRSKRAEMEELNGQIRDKIKVSDDIKLKMCDHLGSIVNLLRIAKEIAESKLDETHTHVTKLDRMEKIGLPKEMEDGIDRFTQWVKSELTLPLEAEVSAKNTGNEVKRQDGKQAVNAGSQHADTP